MKILDFGLATVAETELTGPRGAVGTAAYMSPEQARGEPPDPRADLWSLGAVLHEMLAGQRPFPGVGELAVLYSVLYEDPVPLETARPAAPAAFREILRRTLAKDPDARYPSASAMAVDLAALTRRSSDAPVPASRHVGAVGQPAGNLPIPLADFVGREAETVEIRRLLSRVRLVTLTGPPGTGKTRLALEVARRVGGGYEDGAWLVSLAPISDPGLVDSTVASALGAEERPGPSTAEDLVEHLRHRRLLLVLDNFEHVVKAAPLIAELLEACPGVRMLVTSRVALRVRGEQEYPVAPLDLPDPDRLDQEAALREASATTLFLRRAAEVRPDWRPTGTDVRAVAEICAQLDGLPLAIELAAARVKLFGPRAMLARLNRPLDLLTGGARDGPDRHRTLRRAIAWSHGLLSPGRRALLRRLAVFSGGCTLEAAEDVCGATLEDLSALVGRSLVQGSEAGEGAPRFHLLETLREFGLEQLRRSGEEEDVRRVHAEHFLDLAEEARPHLKGPRQREWLERLEAERDNLRAAMDWAEDREEPEIGLRLGAALWLYWTIRGRLEEGRDRLKRLLSIAGAHGRNRHRARALNGIGTIVHEISEFEVARTYLEESLAIWREVGERSGVARALNNLAWIACMVGDGATARSLSLESLSLHREIDKPRGIATSLNNLAWVAHLRGEFDAARSLQRQTLALRRQAGDERGTAYALVNLAWAEQRRGCYAEADELVEKALSILTDLGERQIHGWALRIQGATAHARGRVDRAATLLEESLHSCRRSGNRFALSDCLIALAHLTMDLEDRGRAAELLDEAILTAQDTGSRWALAGARCAAGRLALAAGESARARECHRRSLRLRRQIEARCGIAESLEGLARVSGAEGAWREASVLSGAADALRNAIGAPRPPRSRTSWGTLLERGRSTLGRAAFREGREEGRAMQDGRADGRPPGPNGCRRRSPRPRR